MEKLRAIFVLALLSAFIMITVPVPGAKAQYTYLWSGDASSDGTPVTSPPLTAGREYQIVVYGVWNPAWAVFADAQYYTTSTWAAAVKQVPSFLQIDGANVEWGMWSDTPYYHTYTIYRFGTGAAITFAIVDLFDGDYTNNECHLKVIIYEGPMVPPIGETAWAYGGDFAHCFKQYGIHNWGWTNGPLGAGDYEFDIYAGAGKCDITKGTVVGTLTINYDGSTATVAYDLNDPWMMDYTQLYVGSDPLPMDDKGKYTASPGQFPLSHYFPEGGMTDEFTVPDLSGPIYVAAHADVFEA